MKTIWFLILVMTHPDKPNVEIHSALGMESGLRCEQLKLESFKYGVYIDLRDVHIEEGNYRTPLDVVAAACEEREMGPEPGAVWRTEEDQRALGYSP